MHQLMILISSSGADWETLQKKPGLPRQQVNYIECDTGVECSVLPIVSERLLCMVKLEPPDLTAVVATVIDQCKGADIVIGTHTRRNSPSTVLTISALQDRCRAIQNYTTASPVYRFVADWCRELSRERPDPDSVKSGYDRLYDLLANSVEPLADVLSAQKHEFENLWGSAYMDVTAWIESRYSREYLTAIARRSVGRKDRLLSNSRRILYSKDSGLLRNVERVVDKLPESSNDGLRQLVRRVRYLLPDVDVDGGIEFINAMKVLDALEVDDYEAARATASCFVEWKHTLQDALDPLLDSIGQAA
jgi:hypothetical protein